MLLESLLQPRCLGEILYASHGFSFSNGSLLLLQPRAPDNKLAGSEASQTAKLYLNLNKRNGISYKINFFYMRKIMKTLHLVIGMEIIWLTSLLSSDSVEPYLSC